MGLKFLYYGLAIMCMTHGFIVVGAVMFVYAVCKGDK